MDAPRQARFDEAVLLRVAGILTGVGALAVAAFGLFVEPEVKLKPNNQQAGALEHELSERLMSLRAAWDPRERQRILAAAPDHKHLSGALHRLLRMNNQTLAVEGMQYAAAMGDSALREVVVPYAKTGNKHERPVALLSVEQLGPWEEEDLVGFLTDDTPSVKVAALQLIAKRQDGIPWHHVLAAFADEAEEVRAAAGRALAADPPEEVLRQLWQEAQDDDLQRARRALGILGAAGQVQRFEERVTRMLASRPELTTDCLSFLAAKAAPLADAKRVRQLVEDWQLSNELRAQALHCLEQTSSADVQWLRQQAPKLEPQLQYFAARCMLAHGDHKAGSELLLILAQSEDESVATAGRQLLAWLTGLSPGSKPEAFGTTLEQRAQLSRTHLPAPPPGL